MTVEQLIMQLNELPKNAEVFVWDFGHGGVAEPTIILHHDPGGRWHVEIFHERCKDC